MKINLFLAIIVAYSCNSYAQKNASSIGYDDRPKDFFKRSQLRFLERISESKIILEKDSIRINSISNLDDTLLLQGNITDSTAKFYKQRLDSFKKQNDSLLLIAQTLKSKLNTTASVRNNMKFIMTSVSSFYIESVNKRAERKRLIDKVEIDLRASNLGEEKKQLKKILGDANKQQKVEAKKLNGIGDVKTNMLGKGNIDSATAAGVDTRITKYLQKMEANTKEINTLEKKINTPEDYAKNSASIKTRVLIIDSIVNKSAPFREYTFKMIEEGLQKSTKTLFSLGAFFGPGGHVIPSDKFEKAKKYFSPVIDSLIKFSNKYADLPRTATILVNGYADASNISLQSKLYNEITTYLKVTNPPRAQLNICLSAMRAEELSSLFTKIIKEKYPEFKALPKIIFENVEIGRGEEYPDPKVKNYKTNDDRRRVVIVYWSVLPNN